MYFSHWNRCFNLQEMAQLSQAFQVIFKLYNFNTTFIIVRKDFPLEIRYCIPNHAL